MRCWHSCQSTSGGTTVKTLFGFKCAGVLKRGKGATDALLAQLPNCIRWDGYGWSVCV